MEGNREGERDRVSRETDITKVHYNKTDRDIYRKEEEGGRGGGEGKEEEK